MTNGDKLHEAFPELTEIPIVPDTEGDGYYIDPSWYNSEYKEPSDTKTDNIDIKKRIPIYIGFVLIVILLYFIFKSIDSFAEEKRWNDGYCECGGELSHIHTDPYGYEPVYIYKCDTCGETFSFYTQR